MLPQSLAVSLLEFFAARALNLLIQIADVAVERSHYLNGFVHSIDQALALGVCETAAANHERHPHNLAAQPAAAATVFACFLSCPDRLQLFGQVAGSLVMLLQLVDAARDFFDAVLEDLPMISSSSKTTVSLIERTPCLKSSPMVRTCRITIGERESAFNVRSCPRSMRLAISTSHPRVS